MMRTVFCISMIWIALVGSNSAAISISDTIRFAFLTDVHLSTVNLETNSSESAGFCFEHSPGPGASSVNTAVVYSKNVLITTVSQKDVNLIEQDKTGNLSSNKILINDKYQIWMGSVRGLIEGNKIFYKVFNI